MAKSTSSKSAKSKSKTTKKSVVSYHRKPDDLTMDEWQIALRKQFAENQKYAVTNIGAEEVLSEYNVSNFDSKQVYKVAIRGEASEWNFCSCMDFKTNQLGTCKHIEYVLLQLSKKAKNRKILKTKEERYYTSVYLSYKGERTVKIRIGTENKKEFEKIAKEYFDEYNQLRSNKWKDFDQFLLAAHAVNTGFRCYPDALEYVLDQREALHRNETIDFHLKNDERFFSSIIKTSLFPYQKEGVEFALRKGRCLIADDMGLGKTIQAIGAAEGMKKLYGISKVLIVCPTSLKYQWKTEIQKFTDSEVSVIEGNIWGRKEQYAQSSFYKICSYNVVGRDIDTININDFDLVILDEAQRIKNWQTQTAINIKRIQSKFCIVLTGTPLENKLEELYSVMQMIDPLILGALFRFVTAHQITNEETGKVIGYKDLDKISELLKDSVLRRHKRNVLNQLPERTDKNLFVPMTKEQLAYYDEAYDNVARLVNKWIRFKFLNEKDRQRLLINLNVMRMACNSTFILDQKTYFGNKIDELMMILDEAFISPDEKVVIFSQWERMTRIVAKELTERGIGFESLHGGVPSKNREKLFDNFRNDPDCRVFLSTDAGGVGLNLQSASLLINLDLPWNPAVLEQRIARIHRMGQKKKVQIINIISQGTIEEEMLAKLKFKSSLAAGILDQGESSVFLEESKFNELMNQVKDLTSSESAKPISKEEEVVQVEIDKETEKLKSTEKTVENLTSETEKQLSLFDDGDNDNKVERGFKQTPDLGVEPQDLITTGMSFFGKLMQTLSDEKKTEELVHTIIKKDEDGTQFLKIPIKDEKIIQEGLKLLQKMFVK